MFGQGSYSPAYPEGAEEKSGCSHHPAGVPAGFGVAEGSWAPVWWPQGTTGTGGRAQEVDTDAGEGACGGVGRGDPLEFNSFLETSESGAVSEGKMLFREVVSDTGHVTDTSCEKRRSQPLPQSGEYLCVAYM